MQTRSDAADMSMSFYSLDRPYFIIWDISYDHIAVADYTRKFNTELNMRAGDRIGILGNLLNGHYKGINRRTRQTGSFPSHLVTFSVIGSYL